MLLADFVRNPFSRLVSVASAFKIKVEDFLDNLDEYIPHHSLIEEKVTKEVYNKRNIYFHAQPASVYTHYEGKPMVDFLGKFENLQEDFKEFCSVAGIKYEKLKHMNKTKHRDYRSYYNEDRVERVSRIFGDDLRLYGYSFGG